ncbi:hypothetical protein KKJ06_07745 [Xenorhabdus bovienii]|uniref:hypothetical protein n=1 Tax=Xenorhabdus bovienii TaxID=40576 RepID=UPI0023B23AFA|nr:hypothetical protein [Xenorhabdus bovienii]MDE9555331.1 hypothetical protein [Xenorhabdus bovienii]
MSPATTWPDISSSWNDGQSGTLIITKIGVFDAEEQDDVRKANAIESQLADLEFLPLIEVLSH